MQTGWDKDEDILKDTQGVLELLAFEDHDIASLRSWWFCFVCLACTVAIEERGGKKCRRRKE
jgi:hypothetical protein